MNIVEVITPKIYELGRPKNRLKSVRKATKKKTVAFTFHFLMIVPLPVKGIKVKVKSDKKRVKPYWLNIWIR